MTNCDFDNDAMTCPWCGYVAGGRNWNKNCLKRPVLARIPGAGDKLHGLISSIGVKRVGGCVSCGEMLGKMNAWGITGCRENRAEIVAHLKAAYRETSWADFAAASAKAIASGLAFKINPLDPFGSLVDEAIRLAEVSPPAT